MEPKKLESKTYNYQEIFSDYFFKEDTPCKRMCPDHVLIFVYSGELVVRSREEKVCVHQGGYIFLCRDSNIILEKKSFANELFQSIFMGFSQSFLNEFYRNLNKKIIQKNRDRFNKNIIEISKNPYIESLYISMNTYFKWGTTPVKEVLEIKLTEAVYCLLSIDKRFFSCLFTPIKKKKDILYLQDCTITKCLQTAYLKIQNGDKTTNIYMEVAYSNVRSIIRIYDNSYRFSL